jgi:pyruvate dehydrogenase E1 component
MSNPEIKKYSNLEHVDIDPSETAEWNEAFIDLIVSGDGMRAKFILDSLVKLANKNQINWVPDLVTPYINSIPVDEQPHFPGDLAIE